MRHRHHPIPLTPALTAIIAAGYAGFGAYRGARLWWAWRQTIKLLRTATCCHVPLKMMTIWDRYSRDLNLGSVSLLCSSEVTGPVTLGVRHPVVILPRRFLMQVSQEEFASALCHEFAHIRRRDFVVNLICELFMLPISFHPAAVYIKARIDHNRELACDEMAAEKISKRTTYARSLVSIARSMQLGSSASQSRYGLGLFDTYNLEERIMNLIENTNIVGSRRVKTLIAFASSLMLGTCMGLSAFSIQLAQTDQAKDFRPFVGTWLAKFRDRKFQTLKLLVKDNQLTGTCSRINIEMDSNGELTRAEQKDGDDPISNARIVGKVLHLTVGTNGHIETAQGSEDEPIEFEMTLTGTDQAELRILGAPPNMPAPKPWKLERTHVSP